MKTAMFQWHAWLRSPANLCDRWLGNITVVVAWFGLLLAAFSPPHGTGIAVCWFKNSTGFSCLGCGLTRSLSCALRGMVVESWQYHPLGPVHTRVIRGRRPVQPAAPTASDQCGAFHGIKSVRLQFALCRVRYGIRGFRHRSLHL